LPSDREVPEYVESEFGEFYRAMFARQTERENGRAVFLEYAWDMAWCDPCAADPLSSQELRKLGVFWTGNVNDSPVQEKFAPQAQNVFVTRLHVRYDQQHFPEDLMLSETGDRSNFQGRYVIRRPWKGPSACNTDSYTAALRERQEMEARTLASLTGWDIEKVRARIPFAAAGTDAGDTVPWWKSLWN
jgi:hypothetical protein